MLKFIKYLILTLLLVVIGSFSAVYFLIDKNDISSFIKKETNKEVMFEEFKINIFPSPSIYLKNVVFNEKDIIELSIKKAAVNLDFTNRFDLKSYKIKSILLDQPNVKIFEQNEKQKETKNNDQELSLIDIDNFIIKNGTIIYKNETINNFTCNLSMTKEGLIDIKTFLIKQIKGLNDLSLKGNIDISKKDPYIDLNIKNTSSNIPAIAKSLDLDLPSVPNKEYLKNLSFEFNAKGDISKLYFTNSQIIIDDTTISFETVLKDLNPNNIATVLEMDKLDLNNYIDFSVKKESPKEVSDNSSNIDPYLNYKKIVNILKNIKNLSSVKIGQLKVKDRTIKNIFLKSVIKDKTIDLNPVNLDVYGGSLSGIYKISLKGDKPKFRIKQVIKNLEISKLMAQKEKPLQGKVNLSTNLYFEGLTQDHITSSLKGLKLLKGHDLTFNMYNVDDILDSYEQTQQISLLDIGAMAIAGPFAGLFTQSIKFGILYDKATTKGKTKIKDFISFWSIKDKKATIKDVAIKTQRHLLALKGELDLQENKAAIKLASIDQNNGCPIFSQEINGDYMTQDIDVPVNPVETFLGPIGTLFKSLEKCEPFYSGSLIKK